MVEGNLFSKKLSRRELLRVGLTGLCGLCVIGNSSCRPDHGHDKEDSERGNQLGFVNPQPAAWFSEIDNSKIRCDLCPNQCVLADGERSLCRVRENIGGVGYTLAHGNPALVQEGPIERKPFYHVFPGSRALSISTAGCNLACKFCEVWDMALVSPEEIHAYDLPPSEVIAHAQTSSVASLSYAFGEPVVFYEYLMDVASQAKEAGFLNLIHSAGYIQPAPLKAMSKLIDAANIDLKSFNATFYRDIVGGELEHVLRTLKILRKAGVHIEITNILIPTLNDNIEEIRDMCRWIKNELGSDVPLHFSRFYPLYQLSGLPRTPISTLDRARNIALDEGLHYVYLAKVTGHEAENTFCADCGEKIIHRVGFVIGEMQIDNGQCGFCGESIPGLWE